MTDPRSPALPRIDRPLAASVLICTYNRPLLFEAALRSARRDATTRGLPYEIVVADNGPEGHAAAVVDRVLHSDGIIDGAPVRVVRVSPPNISLARNAAARLAAAPLVAFMDDDLELKPGWLDALVSTAETTGADVVIGPVRPRFPDDVAPAWDPTGSRFTRVLPSPTGTPIAAGGPDKPANFAVSTASSLWRPATCFTDPAPFDPAFGACGGEDLDLFLRLERRGRRFAWCAEAGVRETIPPGRLALRYQWLRAYSGAQVYAAAAIKNAPSRPAAMLNIALRGLLQGMMFTPAALLFAVLGWLGLPGARRRGIDLAFAAIAGWGKLNWWRRVGLYHVERHPIEQLGTAQPMPEQRSFEPRRSDSLLVKEPGG